MRTLLPIAALTDYAVGGFESGDLMTDAIGYAALGNVPTYIEWVDRAVDGFCNFMASREERKSGWTERNGTSL